jgi:hypothetical protein
MNSLIQVYAVGSTAVLGRVSFASHGAAIVDESRSVVDRVTTIALG